MCGRNVRERGLAAPGRSGQQQDLVERARVIRLVTATTAAASVAAGAAIAKPRVHGAAAGRLSVAVSLPLSAVSKMSVGERLRLGLGCVARGGGGALPSALGKYDRIPRLRRNHRRYDTNQKKRESNLK